MCVLRVNNYVLTSSYESEINVWNINDLINKQKDPELNKINPKKVHVFKGHKGPIPKIITYDNKRFLSCGWDESIKMWNLEKFSCEDTISNIGDKLINMNLLKDKITLGVVLNYGDIKLINIKTKEVLMQFEGTYFIYELNDHRLITVLHETEQKIINLDPIFFRLNKEPFNGVQKNLRFNLKDKINEEDRIMEQNLKMAKERNKKIKRNKRGIIK